MKYQRKPDPTFKHFRDSRAFGAPSQEQIADRDHCLAQPVTLAMEIFGDPKPGRSMLDRKRALGVP